ncbi:LrgB family protein, partial [Bacillus sp. B-TM1]
NTAVNCDIPPIISEMAIAIGIMLGTSANGTGTSKAFEIGPVEGTIASLSMLLTAGASLVIVPLFLSWIH